MGIVRWKKQLNSWHRACPDSLSPRLDHKSPLSQSNDASGGKKNICLVLRAIPQITVATQSWDAQNKHNCEKLFCDMDEKYGAGKEISDTRGKSRTYVTLGKFRYMDEKPDTRKKIFDTRRRNNTSYVEWGKFRYMDEKSDARRTFADTRMKNTSYVILGKCFLLLCHDDDLWLESPRWPNITRKQCLIGICHAY